MLPLIAILLLCLTPLIMLIIRLVRPGFAFIWLVAAAGTLLAYPLMLLSGIGIPKVIPLVTWQPETIFPASPALRVDSLSWPYAIALTALALAIILTAVVRQQQSSGLPWAGSLVLVMLGLFAVLAGNRLTLLLAWAALDLVELFILISQVHGPPLRQRVMVTFSIRAAGILFLFWATILPATDSPGLLFENISPQANLLVLLAASLRLGILPFHLPFPEGLPIRRGLGTAIYMASTAGSLVVLGRVASIAIPAPFTTILLALAGLAALYGSLMWAIAGDELNGRPFWTLGTSALSIAAAVRGQPAASLAWGLICLLPGSLLFLTSARHRYLQPLLLAGLLCASSLPFTPAWDAAQVYTPMKLSTLGPLFLLAQILLLAGYVRYAMQLIPSLEGVERWVWVVYPLGLLILPVNDILVSYWNKIPPASWRADWPVSVWGWIGGPVTLGLAILFWVWSQRSRRTSETFLRVWKFSLSLNWLNRLILTLYQSIHKLVDWITTILEGEGGVLWALVLLAILFTVLANSFQELSSWILTP